MTESRAGRLDPLCRFPDALLCQENRRTTGVCAAVV